MGYRIRRQDIKVICDGTPAQDHEKIVTPSRGTRTRISGLFDLV